MGRKYNDPKNIIFTLNNIGLIQIDRAQYTQATETFTEALKIGTELNDDIGICGNYNNLGLIMEKTGNLHKALSYYLSSLKISERMGYSIGISNTCSNLARIYGEINKPDSAMYFSFKGIREARISGSKTYLLSNYDVLYRLFEKTNRLDKALEYYKLYIVLKDSMFNEQKSKQIAEMETKYKTEKKEHENVILRHDIALHKTTQRLLFAAVSALVLLALSLHFLVRYKSRLLIQKSALFEREQKVQTLEMEKKEKERKHLEDQVFAEQEINRLQLVKLNEQNRKLAATALQITAKNNILSTILEEIEQTRKEEVSDPEVCFNKIKHTVDTNMNLDRDWKQFKLHFEEVHPDFFIRLSEQFPALTPGEHKICAYYRINLSTNEIAQILNVTIAGVQKSRHRLRKKLNINSETDMADFMLKF
jgi:DNA-binding CsgD family transcriptional regulator/tetratricopeptide (TPR) repeat protein